MFPTIDKSALETVTGGRYSPIADADPNMLKMMSKVGDDLKQAMQTKMAGLAQHDQMFAQMFQPYLEDMMKGKMGGGKKPDSGKKTA